MPADPPSQRTQIPARLDRLPWSRFHWRVVTALGVTWVIDGLEVTLINAISPVLKRPDSLGLTGEDVGLLTTTYLVGAVLGSLLFGYLTDRLGRKKLFTVTLGLYLASAFATAFAWDFWSLAAFRFFTGAGIGGEYSAINSAIDELIPARVRGRVDLAVNGTFWLGSAAGAVASVGLLDTRYFAPDLGWRFGFGLGAALGLVVIVFRRHIPESPRWLMTHGRAEEAETIVAEVERAIEARPGAPKLPEPEGSIVLKPHPDLGFGVIARTLVVKYPRRTVLGLVLIASQALLYNGVAVTFAQVLTKYYGVADDRAGLYLLPFALGNLLGPLVLGPLFDTVGRKPMIAGTYAASALVLGLSGYLFARHDLTAVTQTALWGLAFVFASAAASSAYLTVSEIFPLEMRGLTIALFYSTGTALGGTVAPWLFSKHIDAGSRILLYHDNLLAGAVLLGTAAVVLAFGVKAEGASLESIADPLSLAAGE